MTTQATEYKKPLPRLTKLNRPYWEAAKNHELRLQRCSDCSHVWFPPAEVCPKCLGENYEWTKVSGRGKVWSWIVMWQRYFPGFADDLPYNVAYVGLEEGPRMMTNIVGCDSAEIRCDMPVEVVFDDVTEEFSLPKFKPVRG